MGTKDVCNHGKRGYLKFIKTSQKTSFSKEFVFFGYIFFRTSKSPDLISCDFI